VGAELTVSVLSATSQQSLVQGVHVEAAPLFLAVHLRAKLTLQSSDAVSVD
jgi:hypothetical protein